MLKLIPNPTFKAKVDIPTPGGEAASVAFEFKHRSKEELDAFLAAEHWKTAGEVQTVMEFVVGWDGVDTPFSAEALDTMFKHYQKAAGAITTKYLAELGPARLGN